MSDPNETMVNAELEDNDLDDDLEEVVEEENDSEPAESIESLTGDKEPAEQQEQAPSGTKEPGYVKRRIAEERAKWDASFEAKLNAALEERLAPFREKQIEMDAKELVASGAVKDLETAKELVRYRQEHGNVSPATQKRQLAADMKPRDEKGQFTSRTVDDAVTSARISMLQHQADQIKAAGGPDVIAAYQTNEDIRQRIQSGDMDFYDVANELKNQKPARKPPSPMRSPNGASGRNNPNAIDNMSDEMFERMDANISKGARYSLK